MIDRRHLLSAAAATPILAAGAARALPELAWLDATATAALIRRRDISAREAVEAAIARARALDPKLHVLVTPDFERALARAAMPGGGPFAGVPTLIKDLEDLQGLPTRNGSRLYAKAPPAAANGPLAQAWLDAGFIPIGKSATPEFGFLPTTEPLATGPTHNPWGLDHTPGGSSGGAAAAVAAGIVPLAHASDAGGSIRIPASSCGVFGLKPSRGRMAGDAASPTEIWTNNAVARSVRDAAGVFAIAEQPAAGYPRVGQVSGPSNRRLRIGWATHDPAGVPAEAEVAAATEAAAALCRGLGHQVEPIEWPADCKGFGDGFIALWAAGAAQAVGQIAKSLGRRPDASLLEPFTLGLAELFASYSPEQFAAAQAAVGRGVGAYLGLFATYDVVLTPVLAGPPPKLGFMAPDLPFRELVRRLSAFVGYTPISNVAGNPAMSVPLAWSKSRLPIGSQFAAGVGQERVLFGLAYALEAARPWAATRPPVRA